MKSIKTHFFCVGIFIVINLMLVVRAYALDADGHNSFDRKPTYEQAAGHLFSEYDISLDFENGFKSELWGILQFEDQGTQLYTVFISLFELDQNKNVMHCNACSAVLASVTYIKNKKGWSIKGMNTNVTRIGSDGSFPNFDQSLHKMLDGTHLILSSDTKLRQGYFSKFAHLIAYLGDWQSVGLMVLLDNNIGSDECMLDSICWYWHTRSIDILTEKTNGLPDILLDRAGTIIDNRSNQITGVSAAIYQFSGSRYQAK